MKVLLVTENLESGGAQRQIVMLAQALVHAGVSVEVIVYYPQDFFLDQLNRSGVPVTFVREQTKVRRVIAIRKAIRTRHPDAVIAYLGTPSVLAELASIPNRRFALLVSERAGRPGRPTLRDRFQFQMHRIADGVVLNSHSLAAYVGTHAPWLRPKLHVILNCVDLDEFHPGRELTETDDLQNLIVVGRVSQEKNALGLVRALRIVVDECPAKPLRINWYGSNYYFNGKPTPASRYFDNVSREVRDLGLAEQFIFRGETNRLSSVYRSASVFCLPSFYESFSNALSEAAACGLTLVASDVGDSRLLVGHANNGFLFDPHCTESIAEALRRVRATTAAERNEMGRKSRSLAEEVLAPSRLAREYLGLLERVVQNRKRR